MKLQLIVTHPGSAHFDEMTAIGLIMAVHPDQTFKIERREPLTQELENPEIWVVDIGVRYEPARRNFDHHQSVKTPASFVLVADYLGLLETMSVMPWWQFKDSVDRIGPVMSSEKFGAGDYLVNTNPIEAWFTSQFASDPESCIPMLKSYGAQIISSARFLKTQIDYWKNSRRLMIAGVPAAIGETRESAGLEEFRRLDKNPPDIIISMDRRDDGWRLFRYDGAPVNFSLIADRPEIFFAHKNGFLAKTKEKLSEDKLVELISRAVIKPAKDK